MSKVRTIYILRHGQTDLNRKGMVQGRGVDSSLNDVGRNQAFSTYEYLKKIPFKKIYTSTLKRTHETVTHFSQEKHQLEGFDEISWGNQEGVTPTHESKSLYAATVKAWQKGNLTADVGGGESPLEVMSRQKKAMEVVFNDSSDLILICMHGRAMRILMSWLLNYPLELMDQFEHQNCGHYKLIQTGSFFRVEEFNQTAHLS